MFRKTDHVVERESHLKKLLAKWISSERTWAKRVGI